MALLRYTPDGFIILGYCKKCDKTVKIEVHITDRSSERQTGEVSGYSECLECGTRFEW